MKGKQRGLAALFGAVLCVLALVGCKDMFHPEGSLIPPASIKATAASSSSITVSWGSVEGASDYRLYRATSSGGTYRRIASTSSTSYTDNDVSPNTTYYYKVRVHNAIGDGEFSSVATATTLAASSSLSPPSSVSATAASSSSITVSWRPVSGASSYRLYRSTSSSGTYSYITNTYDTKDTTYTDTGLSAGTTYYYKVSAYGESGESGLSSYTSATTSSSSPLSPPSSVSAIAGSSSSITVSWNYVSGANSYNIYRSTSSSGTYNLVDSTSSTSYTDTGLSAGTTYYYKVSTSIFFVIGYSESSLSSYGSATTSVGESGSGTLPSDLSLAESLAWISNNAVEGGDYTITINADETIAPQTLSYSGKNVNIALNGGDTERTVSLNSSGPLFTINSGVTLTLGNNITLQGRSNNTTSLVRVYSSGALVMNDGSKITGNTSGGGVCVYDGGTFTMSGGEVSGNTSSNGGGGVCVYDGGTFTMSGGEVSGNTASGYGSSAYGGGGVYVSYGTFTMSGGEVSGNTSSNGGGGVFVSSSGTFTMSGGEVSGNTASNGGGVYVYDGAFTMSGGEISGNTSSSGGGVYVSSSGTFTKQGGTIYGSNASGSLKNTATNGDSYGHAVYVSSSKKRNTTVDADSALDSSVSGAAGGWVDPMTSDLSLAESLAWISANAVEGGDYTITINADETIVPQTLSYSGKNVNIALNGGDAERTVSLSSTGSLFTVESGVTLTLGNNVTLQGLSNNNTAGLVQVSSSGALVMNDGSKISGNTASSSNYNGFFSSATYGGGVFVYGGTFTMNGGEISGNTASTASYSSGYGGGVNVYSGTFTMNGGEISGNTASGYGGGVYVRSGTFTMSGGEISGNTASASSYAYGGGVYVYSGTFTKQGGTIYGSNASGSLKNTATNGASYGHAVYVGDGKIRNTTAGVSVNLNSSVSGSAGGWEMGSVQISLQPTPTSPTLSNASLLVNESASFSAGSDYASYAWYWNGEPISGAASSTYDLAANSKTPGIYELSVIVTTSAGKTLSARCRVVIKAN